MSFYIYSGKLKDDLVVAILPKGTVELDDPVYLISKREFNAYRTQGISSTDDGEDRIAFYDGSYSYEAISKDNYKELKLTRESATGEVDEVALTRRYDQPQVTIPPLSDHARIWSGAINFHDWAKEETFVVVAPQGLEDGRPIVALWQWTKDKDNKPKTLSYGTDKQGSVSGNPEKFSFKQNGYYTLDCQLTETLGLKVTVKSPSNPEQVQKELSLSALIPRDAAHGLTPPKADQQKVTLDCSFPNAKPSLARISTPLPFPAGLVDTLAYSAAYVDQAGYLAKYAIKEYEKLELSHTRLNNKFEARAAKVAALEAEVAALKSQNEIWTNRHKALDKDFDKAKKDWKKKEVEYKGKINTLTIASQSAQTLIQNLKTHIRLDKIADEKLAAAVKKHDAEDHKAMEELEKAKKDAEHAAHGLQEQLDAKNKKYAELEDTLAAKKCELKTAEDKVTKLDADLTAQKGRNAELDKELGETAHLLDVAQKGLTHLRAEHTKLEGELKVEKDLKKDLQKQFDNKVIELNKATEDLKDANADIRRKATTIQSQHDAFNALENMKDRIVQNDTDEINELKQKIEMLKGRSAVTAAP